MQLVASKTQEPLACCRVLAARCAQVLGAFVAFALDQPQAQPLKVKRRQFRLNRACF